MLTSSETTMHHFIFECDEIPFTRSYDKQNHTPMFSLYEIIQLAKGSFDKLLNSPKLV